MFKSSLSFLALIPVSCLFFASCGSSNQPSPAGDSLCSGKPVWFVTKTQYLPGSAPFKAAQGDKFVTLSALDTECMNQAALLNIPKLKSPVQWKSIILAGDQDGKYTAETVAADAFQTIEEAARTAVDPLQCQDRLVFPDGTSANGTSFWFGPNEVTSVLGAQIDPNHSCTNWSDATKANSKTFAMKAPNVALSEVPCNLQLNLLCAAQF